MIPVSAVIASAVEDAVGFRIDAMPISPSRLFELYAEHAAGRVSDTAVGRQRAARHSGDHREKAMKINGSAVLHAPPERVWAAVTDPQVLACRHPRL